MLFTGSPCIHDETGFAMVCASSIRQKNIKNNMLNNILDACFGEMCNSCSNWHKAQIQSPGPIPCMSYQLQPSHRDARSPIFCIICTHHPQKVVPHQVHWTVDSDHIEYLGNVSTKTADIITDKLLFNSVVSLLADDA